MRTFALNHMTLPRLPCSALLALASELGCAGVELRNDLDTPLFDGETPESIRAQAQQHGVSLLALAEVAAFDDGSDRAQADLIALAALAARCGAGGVSLIPRNDGSVVAGSAEARGALMQALEQAAPVLERHGLVGFLEPLGFETASLRRKADAVEIIDALGVGSQIKLVHDTFHHHLAAESSVYAQHTGMVHISGVSDRALMPAQMRDADRGLIDEHDQLHNLEQLAALEAAGYAGPISLEAFAPAVHALDAPQAALANQFYTIRSVLSASAA